jgi:hypothetical protein
VKSKWLATVKLGVEEKYMDNPVRIHPEYNPNAEEPLFGI